MSDRPDQTEQVSMAAADAAAAPRPDLEAIIDQWVNEFIHGSPVARDTSGFNHLHDIALPELKQRLLKGIMT